MLTKGGGVIKSLETADASKYCKLKYFTQKFTKKLINSMKFHLINTNLNVLQICIFWGEAPLRPSIESDGKLKKGIWLPSLPHAARPSDSKGSR